MEIGSMHVQTQILHWPNAFVLAGFLGDTFQKT